MVLSGHEDQPIFLSTAEVRRHWRRYFPGKLPKNKAFEVKGLGAKFEPIQ